ncbi:hypothetical protein Taqua_00837 [Tepidimonas aquatica]|uniref:Uncharacterized protein n=1 Tax=Tepidimonas aquatica TaxID=247482 RepID=A0A554WQZ2_9BURK|nr:hypothetical protein Taqua_00837 [Tepidimonas aquatica]
MSATTHGGTPYYYVPGLSRLRRWPRSGCLPKDVKTITLSYTFFEVGAPTAASSVREGGAS